MAVSPGETQLEPVFTQTGPLEGTLKYFRSTIGRKKICAIYKNSLGRQNARKASSYHTSQASENTFHFDLFLMHFLYKCIMVLLRL